MAKISEELEELIVELLIKGFSVKDIRRKTGISESSIYRIRSKEDFINENTIEDDLAKEEENEDDFTISNQIKYNLNRVAEMNNRSFQDLIEEIEHILTEYSKATDRPLELINYTLYLSEIFMKLQFNDENSIINFLLKAERDNLEIEGVEDKLETIRKNAHEEIEFYRRETEKLAQSYIQINSLNSIVTSRFMKGNKGFMDKIREEFNTLTHQNQALTNIFRNIEKKHPKIIENIVNEIKLEQENEIKRREAITKAKEIIETNPDVASKIVASEKEIINSGG